jgi:hypothetical protein
MLTILCATDALCDTPTNGTLLPIRRAIHMAACWLQYNRLRRYCNRIAYESTTAIAAER